ncbi:HAAS signaling domain-containing protein [Salinibacterium sp. PAMC 21357]|uniref:HAAS signaling domain-containing protein n=1 Tax=Salinibacterium sp. PAMC 21357 TaxID=1112215 RepID=UPI000289C94A|nr:hypothetical protein [Salinibacterium sp. PAMC 21357]
MPNNVPDITTNYLRDLDDALVSLDGDVRRDLVQGAREELHGLDADAARERIAALGDPAFIAAEANDASDRGDTAPSASTAAATAHSEPRALPRPPARAGRGYAITASLLFALGGAIVPVLGWVAGLVMVAISPQWRRWEKLVAILPAPVFGALIFALTLAAPEPKRGDAVNPLVPNIFDIWWSYALLLLVVNLVGGLWLLWRSQRDPQSPPHRAQHHPSGGRR